MLMLHACGQYSRSESHHTPKASVNTVSGTPTRRYSKNPIVNPRRRALSITIKFAIDPDTVSFPASVLDIATASHDVRGSGKCGTTDLNSMTAGTLLIAFE